jgi:hypothetical protein
VEGNEILLLGLGIQAPWRLVDQHLDIDMEPHELRLQVSSERGTKYACPVCGAQCPAHDFQKKAVQNGKRGADNEQLACNRASFDLEDRLAKLQKWAIKHRGPTAFPVPLQSELEFSSN